MADDLHTSLNRPSVPWRRLLLPNEHGSWAFVLEPLILGLLVAFSPAAIWLSLAVAIGFIARKPAKFAFANSAAGDTRALCYSARLTLLAFASVAVLSLAYAVWVSRWQILIPLVVCFPALFVFAVREQEGQTRSLLSELIATGLCSLPLVSIALAANWPRASALALGFVNLARAWPSLLYVRTCLRRSRGKTDQYQPALLAQLFSPLLLALLAQRQLIPPVIIAGNLALSVRAGIFLFAKKAGLTAKQFGVMEIAWGLAYVVLVTLAYRS